MGARLALSRLFGVGVSAGAIAIAAAACGGGHGAEGLPWQEPAAPVSTAEVTPAAAKMALPWAPTPPTDASANIDEPGAGSEATPAVDEPTAAAETQPADKPTPELPWQPTPTPRPAASPSPAAGASTAGGADGPYVAAVCKAFDVYLGRASELITRNPQLATDQVRFIRELAPAMDRFRVDLMNAVPPADTRAYHEQLVETVRDLVERARAGTLGSFDDLHSVGADVEYPPSEVQARLEAIAAKTVECQTYGGSFFLG